MRRESEKKRKEREATNPARRFYVDAADGRCEACGVRADLDCHEIPAGSHRHRAVWKPNVWLATCRSCHDRLQGAAFEEQYAVKCRAVARSINECVGRQVIDD